MPASSFRAARSMASSAHSSGDAQPRHSKNRTTPRRRHSYCSPAASRSPSSAVSSLSRDVSVSARGDDGVALTLSPLAVHLERGPVVGRRPVRVAPHLELGAAKGGGRAHPVLLHRAVEPP